ncbi:hypothetical protein SLA2020_320090 [Shorea laevis]
MEKELRCVQNWGEVTPTIFISHQKCSTSPKLETIVEEGCRENLQVLPKRIFFLLPAFLSLGLFYLVV